MLRLARAILAAALSVAVLGVVATPAQAAPRCWKVGDGYQCESPQPGTPGTPGNPGGSGGAYDPGARICTRTPQPSPPPGWMHVAEPPAPTPGAQSVNEWCGPADVIIRLPAVPTDDEFFAMCRGNQYAATAGCGVTYGIWGEPDAPTPGELARSLWAAMPIAPPDALETNPPAGGGGTLVRFPTWFWAAGGTVGEQSAQTADGVVRVEARPTYVLSPGDGSSVECDGPGTPYDGRDASASSPDCGHTYDRAGSHTATFEVTWTPAWFLNDAEQTGDVLDPRVVSASTDLLVRESQAIVVRPR